MGKEKKTERKRYDRRVNQVRKSVPCLHVEITTCVRPTIGVTWLITWVGGGGGQIGHGYYEL